MVVLKTGEGVSQEDIITFCKEHIARYKAPKSVDFTNSLPKNSAGKIVRKNVREKYWIGQNRRVH